MKGVQQLILMRIVTNPGKVILLLLLVSISHEVTEIANRLHFSSTE